MSNTAEKLEEPDREQDNERGEGDNQVDGAFIVQCTSEMADIDAQRKTLNRQAADIRDALKDRGVDTDAFKDVYAYFKKKRHEREGYDTDYKLCFDALNDADTGALFAFQDDKE